MSDRGIKKWAPYKTLEEQDFSLRGHKEKEEKIEKPTISAEFAEEINEILVNYSGELLKIKYFKDGKILEVTSKVKTIDPITKKLVLFSKKSIMITDIVFIEIVDEEENL